MPPSFNDPPKAITPQDVDAWLLTAKELWGVLQRKAALPWPRDECREAFTDMSALLQQAFEEVRVINEQLREIAQTAHDRSTQLMQHSRTSRALRESAPPSPEEIRKAESQLLAMFRGGNRHDRHTPGTEGVG